MIVYGLVLGHGPSDSPIEAFHRALSKEDPYSSTATKLLAKGFSEPWANAVAACLALDHEKRPRSVTDVAQLLGENIASALDKPPAPGSLLGASAQAVEQHDPLPSEAERDSSGDTEKAKNGGGVTIKEKAVKLPGADPVRVPPPPRSDTHRPPRPPVGLAISATVALILGSLIVFRVMSSSTPVQSNVGATSGAPFINVSTDPSATPGAAWHPDSVCKDYDVLCDGKCRKKVDPDWGCGSCKTCKKGVNVVSLTCAASACKIGVCEGSYDDCNHDPKDGCEIDKSTDIKNCGDCGNACVSRAWSATVRRSSTSSCAASGSRASFSGAGAR